MGDSWTGCAASLEGSYQCSDGSALVLESLAWNMDADYDECAQVDHNDIEVESSPCSNTEEALCETPSGKFMQN